MQHLVRSFDSKKTLQSTKLITIITIKQKLQLSLNISKSIMTIVEFLRISLLILHLSAKYQCLTMVRIFIWNFQLPIKSLHLAVILDFACKFQIWFDLILIWSNDWWKLDMRRVGWQISGLMSTRTWTVNGWVMIFERQLDLKISLFARVMAQWHLVLLSIIVQIWIFQLISNQYLVF